MAGRDTLMAGIGFVVLVTMCLFSAETAEARSPSIFGASVAQLRQTQQGEDARNHMVSHTRRLHGLVEMSPLILPYHTGPIMSGESAVHIYIVWYGTFSELQRSTIVDFFGSFLGELTEPSVRSWWKTTEEYRDLHGSPVMADVILAGQSSNAYSKGKSLTEDDLQELVEQAIASGAFPADAKSIYFILTAEDVNVERFCMNTCGSHHFTPPSGLTKHQQLPYVWVGNAVSRCAGRCAWPYAKPVYGPNTPPLIAPNGDVGVDGMIINIATLLAGTVTNPYSNGYFQGDASTPLEAATACAGIYGEGAYPGHPGTLLIDSSTGASYNAHGLNDRKFLLPALWDPSTLTCRNAFVPQIDVIGGGEEAREGVSQ